MTNVIIRKRGTLVIPAAIREHLGWDEGTVVAIDQTGDGVLIRPANPTRPPFDVEAFWKAVDRDFAELQKDPVAWAEYKAEFESTETLDGLEYEPPYPL